MPAATLPRSFDIPPDLLRDMRGLRGRLLAIGAAALILCIIGGFFDSDQFFRSYIWCYMFYIGLTLGCTGAAIQAFAAVTSTPAVSSRTRMEPQMSSSP